MMRSGRKWIGKLDKGETNKGREGRVKRSGRKWIGAV